MTRLAPFLLLFFALAPDASAQLPPKPGRVWFEENTNHGFRLKTPKDWAFFPPEFGQVNVLGRYIPERNDVYELGSGEAIKPAMWVLLFDQDYEAPKIEGDSEADIAKRALSRHYKDLNSWLKGNAREVGADFSVTETDKVVKLKGDITALPELRKGRGRWAKEIHLWSVTYSLSDRKDVVVLFNAPADRKNWGKWKSQVKKFASGFARAEIEGFDGGGVEGSGVRAAKHRKLLEEVASNPGWELYVTDNYFVISNSDDREFVREVQERLELIRERFAEDYPVEKALRAYEVRQEMKKAGQLPELDEEDGDDGEPDGEQDGDGADAQEDRTEVQSANPLELSRCSVVRVCNSAEDYSKYGGPPGSAGYWWSVSEELVLYDAKGGGGRNQTWATLHHEAFHQFIYYFFGQLSPGYWFNEGTADYYGGHELSRRGRYEVERSRRNTTIQSEIKAGRNVPLETLVHMKRRGYYAQGPVENPRTGKSETFSRYPHGWSLVYFLRTGEEKRAKGWRDEYGGILDRYLDVLIETRNIKEATEQAFAGIDWEELEECWEEYILKGK